MSGAILSRSAGPADKSDMFLTIDEATFFVRRSYTHVTAATDLCERYNDYAKLQKQCEIMRGALENIGSAHVPDMISGPYQNNAIANQKQLSAVIIIAKNALLDVKAAGDE